MIRLGVDEVIDGVFLADFPPEVRIVRIPEEPQESYAVDFWVPAMPPSVVKAQWPHLQGVRVVQAPWAGVDTLTGLFPPEVVLCDARGVHDVPTAEWTLAAILAMQKCLPLYIRAQDRDDWTSGQQAGQADPPQHAKIRNLPPLTTEVCDAVVLLVGYGAIGQAIEARLAAFGATFLRVARHARGGVYGVDQLDELLPQGDIVVLIAPLTSETRHLMNAARIASMKRRALLVNAARGPIVETEALLDALQEGRIRAALDVTDPEPLPAGHPLWKAPNLLITPHIAGDSAKFMGRAFQLIRAQVGRVIRGEPLQNVVSGQY
jgi:phosphoglycerate dehydrogenase-like enzyme